MSKWREVKLEEIGKIVAGGTPSTKVKDYWNGNIGWITPKDLSNYNNKYISNGERNITEEGLKRSSAKLMPKGTLLMTSRAPIGYLAIAESNISTNQGFKSIICNEKLVNNEFLYYYFKTNMNYIKLFSSGATFPEISGSKFKNIKILIPDLETQEKIADVLSTYDELIENNNRRIEILEKKAEEIYKEWFVRMRFPGYKNTKFVKGIPNGWGAVKLEDICNLVRGISYSTKEIEKNKGIAMLTLKSVKAYGGYNYDGLRFFDGKIAERHYLKENDLIMAITDMTQDRRVIGQVCLIPKTNYNDLVFSADLILLDELKVEKDYMYALLRYGGLSEHIAMFSNGANVLHLNQRILNKIRIVIASEPLRKEYGSKHKFIQKEVGILEIQNENLIKQRDLLLPRLMNGTIEVK